MKKITCILLLIFLVISASIGGCGWAGKTAGQTKARVERQADVIHGSIERQADAFQKGYETGYQQEKAKQNQQENVEQSQQE